LPVRFLRWLRVGPSIRRHVSRYCLDPVSSCVYSSWQKDLFYQYSMAQFEAISKGVLEVTRTPRGSYPPLVVVLGALGRARVSQEQEQDEAEGEDAAYEEVAAD
jgi:hypothetical protein